MSTPGTLPADFFDKKKKSPPETLPPDFFNAKTSTPEGEREEDPRSLADLPPRVPNPIINQDPQVMAREEMVRIAISRGISEQAARKLYGGSMARPSTAPTVAMGSDYAIQRVGIRSALKGAELVEAVPQTFPPYAAYGKAKESVEKLRQWNKTGVMPEPEKIPIGDTLAGVIGINAENVRQSSGVEDYVDLGVEGAGAIALTLLGGKAFKGKGKPAPEPVKTAAIASGDLIPSVEGLKPATASELQPTAKRTVDLAESVYTRLSPDGKKAAPVPASKLPTVAARKSELGSMSDLIPDKRLSEGSLPEALKAAEASRNPIERMGAKAIKATVDLDDLPPEMRSVAEKIANLPSATIGAEAMFDAARRNESPLGSLKATMSKYAFDSVAGHLEKQGEAGQLMSKALFQERGRAEAMSGRFTKEYIEVLGEDLLGLKEGSFGPSQTMNTIRKGGQIEKNFVTVVDLMEGKQVPGAAPELVRAADRLRVLFDDIHARAEKAGVVEVIPVKEKLADGKFVRLISEEFENRLLEDGGQRVGNQIHVPVMRRENYFPHMFDAEIIDRPQMFADLRQQLVKDGVVANEAAADRYIREVLLPRSERLAGNIQRSRMTDSSFYRKDPVVVLEYISKVSKKIAETEMFGRHGEAGLPIEASNLIENIRAQGGDYHFANDVARRHFGAQAVDPSMNAAANVLVSYAVAAQMSLATIANLSQLTNAMWRAPLSLTLSAVKSTVKSFNPAEMAALRDGAIVPTVHKELMTALGLRTRPNAISFWRDPASAVLRANKFLATENWNRVTSYVIGRKFAEHALADLKKNPNNPAHRAAFKDWMGLDADRIAKQGELYESDLAHAGKFYAEKTQFRSGLPDLPYMFGSSPMARVLLLYKGFGYNQARLFSSAIKEAIRTKNFPLLAKAIGIPVVAGEAVSSMRNLISGKDREDSMLFQKYGMAGRIVEDMSYGAGMGLMTDALMTLTYDSKAGLAKLAVGPVFGKGGELIGAAFKDAEDLLAEKRGEKDAPAGARTAREVAGSLPGVAPIAKRVVSRVTESDEERRNRVLRKKFNQRAQR